MEKYWSRRAREITPYVAGEQPRDRNIIKLNTNENPYPPSEKVMEAIAAVDGASVRRYPDPGCEGLRGLIAKRHGVTPDMVFVGNGSDDVLAIAFMSYFDGGLVMPDITYSFYPVWAELFGIDFERIPTGEDFSIDPADYEGRRNIVLANPNAPTSVALPLTDIGRIAKSASGTFIVDEAYAEFGAESAVPLIESMENVVVVRTMSKSHALAGLRVGYAIGRAEMIEAMNRVRDSFNSYPVDAVAQRAAAAAIADEAYTAHTIALVKATRARLTERLAAMGFRVLPSSANFVFCTHDAMNAADIMARLREKGIIVRRFGGERIKNWLRITVGTDAETDALLDGLGKIIPKG